MIEVRLMLRKYVATALGLFFVASAPLLAADKKTDPKKTAEPTKFLRLKRDGKDNPTALEVAITRYVPADGTKGVTVDLVGVVHIGDKEYYQALNKKFKDYDVVLYELVAPEGTRVPEGGKREKENLLSKIQDGMKNMLELDSQLEYIDYSKKNFVHADLSPEKMKEAMKERGDDGFTVALSVFTEYLRKQNKAEMKKDKEPTKGTPSEDLDLLSLLTDPQAATKLKRTMAEQFEAEGGDGGLGPTLNTILVEDRNKAALKVLQKEMAKGNKKIAIFYGAAHMPDFEKRLKEDFDMKKDSQEWLTAWDMTKKIRVTPPLMKLLEGFGK
jgi:hypothetical protein